MPSLLAHRDLILPLVPGTEADLLKALIECASNQLGYDTALDVARYLVNRIRVDALADSRPGWFQGVAAGLDAMGATPDQAGLQPSDLVRQSRRGSSVDDGLHLKTGEHLQLEEVLASVEAVEDLRVLLEAEERQGFGSFDWAAVVEHLTPHLHSTTELVEVENLIDARLSGEHLSRHRLSRSFTALSRQWVKLGDRSSAWRLGRKALEATEASGWSPYFDGGARHAAIRQLIAIDADRAREIAIDLCTRDLGERLHYPGTVVLHLYDVLTLLSDRVPVSEVWSAIEDYLDDLFVAVLVEPQPALETLLEEPVETSGEDTPEQAVADLLVLYLDHPSYAVAQAAVQGCTAALLDASLAVTTALKEALESSDQVVERALMVLDAARMEDPSVAASFNGALTRLRSSPNFTVRLIASAVYARISDESPVPCTVERETPAVYSLHLPELTFHHTEEMLEQRDAPTLIGDPAQILRPLDLEARTVAEAAGLPEDNVLYRAAQHLRRLETERTWLAGDQALDQRRISVFLDQVGLKHAYYKPHVEPARHALAYTVAELYDGGYLSPDELTWLSRVLIHHDPAFIHWRPVRRPRWIGHMGGIADEGYSHIRVPDDWVEEAEDSHSLLRAQTSEGWFVIGERTRLKRLQETWPEEERIATSRAVAEDRLWEGFDVASGHPPFVGPLSARVSDYLSFRAPEDHLVIACDGRYFETPAVDWLALNPSWGQALGWRPMPGPWFRWADQHGNLVVKSVWWRDGNLHCYSEHFHVEVGSGWLVLINQSGLEDVMIRAGCLSRGGVVRRSLGWHGDAGRGQAIGVLELQ
ncbi:MAG: hypothetical protein GF355_10660 [Candidatus Eisenbacteria bacterium]|nr:hypothetical protein [Candidatus Eisenbacteria bacterium]